MSGPGRAVAVERRAPAKLTLSLRVLGTRPDGYHELDALAVALAEPADHVAVTVEPGSRLAGSVGTAGAAGEAGAVVLELHGRTEGVPPGEENLVVRAARAVVAAGRPSGRVLIRLTKAVPPGSGLGGGSSDAAAVLAALGATAGVPRARLLELAAELGSDVPACLHGGPVIMRGRGEVVRPVALAGPLAVLVVVPRLALSTPEVYRAWDDLGGPEARTQVTAPMAVAPIVPVLANDLELAADRVEPRLARVRDALEGLTGAPVLLAGSGSALWTLGPEPGGDPAALEDTARRAARDLGVDAYATVAGGPGEGLSDPVGDAASASS